MSLFRDAVKNGRVITTLGGQQAYQTIQPIQGYSIFVSSQGGRFVDSLRFARLLGEQMLALGRPPTLHHAELGEERPLLDARTGIYQFDGLAVLRRAQVPAVLLELGVIVDEADEAYVSDSGKRQAMVQAIVRAAQQYQASATAAAT